MNSSITSASRPSSPLPSPQSQLQATESSNTKLSDTSTKSSTANYTVSKEQNFIAQPIDTIDNLINFTDNDITELNNILSLLPKEAQDLGKSVINNSSIIDTLDATSKLYLPKALLVIILACNLILDVEAGNTSNSTTSKPNKSTKGKSKGKIDTDILIGSALGAITGGILFTLERLVINHYKKTNNSTNNANSMELSQVDQQQSNERDISQTHITSVIAKKELLFQAVLGLLFGTITGAAAVGLTNAFDKQPTMSNTASVLTAGSINMLIGVALGLIIKYGGKKIDPMNTYNFKNNEVLNFLNGLITSLPSLGISYAKLQ